jgi:hypothetical protein
VFRQDESARLGPSSTNRRRTRSTVVLPQPACFGDLRERPIRADAALFRLQEDLRVLESTHVGFTLGKKRFDFRTFARRVFTRPISLPRATRRESEEQASLQG